MSTSRFLILFASLLILSSCVTPLIEDIPEKASGEGSLTAEVNDDDFSVTGLLVTAEATQANNSIFTFAIGAAELPIGGLSRSISLSVVSTDGSAIEAGETYTAASMMNASAGEYSFQDNTNVNIRALSSNTNVASVTITKIDMVAKRVSGTFSFDGADKNDPNIIYEVRNGEFTDVFFE